MTQTKKPNALHARWTESDDNLLRELIRKGCDASQISQILGRTRGTISQRKRVLGISDRMKNSPKGAASPLYWKSRSKTNPAPTEEGNPIPEVSKTKPVVQAFTPKFSEKPSFLHMRWSPADDALLKELIEKGSNASQISQALGRTRSSIFGRRIVLGIPSKIKRTEKGQAIPLTWSKRSTKNPQDLPQKEIAAVAENLGGIPTNPENLAKPSPNSSLPDSKGKANKVPYNVKLAQTNLRRRRGDIRKVAKMTGFSEGFVSTVVNGLQDNEKIMSVFYNMVRGRKTNESMMKK